MLIQPMEMVSGAADPAQPRPEHAAGKIVHTATPRWLNVVASGLSGAGWIAVAGYTLKVEAGPTAVWALFTVVSLAILAWIAWVWWTIVAAVNARRISPLAVSPWLPVMVYLGAPTLVAAGWVAFSRGKTAADAPWLRTAGLAMLVVGGLYLAFGALGLLVSFRSTAARIGADPTAFSRMLWLPLIVTMGGGAAVGVVAAAGGSPTAVATARLAVGGVATVLHVATAWKAMSRFDNACHRDRSREFCEVAPQFGNFMKAVSNQS